MEAFREMFNDYDRLGGNGYIHTIVQPAMAMLQVVEVGELHAGSKEGEGDKK